MKALFIVLSLLFSASSFAQNHMIEFKADSLLLGDFKFSESRGRESTSGSLSLNFARTVSENVQVGLQGGYDRYNSRFHGSESYSALIGAIYNFNSDFRDTFYTSLYAGWMWMNEYGNGNARYEYFMPKLSFGKRIPLTRFGFENVTYSPEITYQYLEETSSSLWTQSFSIKFLQFSLFW